jgi:hypothetical protein
MHEETLPFRLHTVFGLMMTDGISFTLKLFIFRFWLLYLPVPVPVSPFSFIDTIDTVLPTGTVLKKGSTIIVMYLPASNYVSFLFSVCGAVSCVAFLASW